MPCSGCPVGGIRLHSRLTENHRQLLSFGGAVPLRIPGGIWITPYTQVTSRLEMERRGAHVTMAPITTTANELVRAGSEGLRSSDGDEKRNRIGREKGNAVCIVDRVCCVLAHGTRNALGLSAPSYSQLLTWSTVRKITRATHQRQLTAKNASAGLVPRQSHGYASLGGFTLTASSPQVYGSLWPWRLKSPRKPWSKVVAFPRPRSASHPGGPHSWQSSASTGRHDATFMALKA